MANEEHVAILKKGVKAWNAWRDENPDIDPDLNGVDLREGYYFIRANLRGANLHFANLSAANLSSANLKGAVLSAANLSAAAFTGANLGEAGADLSEANLSFADLSAANLGAANLSRANLSSAYLSGANLGSANLSAAELSDAHLGRAYLGAANLSEANLTRAKLGRAYLDSANLREANLTGAELWTATLVETDLTGADLTGCRVYGVSAWGLKLDSKTKQQNLIITREDEPTVTVDNIEVAQFIYLMLNNQKVRDVIDTITSKAVLILGRFTAERKAVLDALREELRKRDYLPILFDFEVPATRNITETVTLLARMARFIVADITDAKSIPQELSVVVPDLPSVPVQPLLLEGSAEYGMSEHFKRYPWVLETYRYPSLERLIANLGERVIGPAEDYARSIR